MRKPIAVLLQRAFAVLIVLGMRPTNNGPDDLARAAPLELKSPEAPAGAPGAVKPELLLQFGHRSAVLCMAVSPDGQHVATAGYEGAAWLWDLSTGRQLAMFHGTSAHSEASVESLAFTPDGRHLMMTYAGQPELWEMASGARVQVYPREANTGWGSASLSPDGQYLLVGTRSQDPSAGRVTLWDTAHTRLMHTLVERRGPIVSIAFSADSRRAAYTLRDGNIIVFDCVSGQVVTTLNLGDDKPGPIAFHPDGKHLLAGSRTIAVFDLETGQRQREMEIGNPQTSLTLDISPDGSRVLIGTEGKKSRLLDYANGHTRVVLGNPTNQITHAHFTSDGTRGDNGCLGKAAASMRVWNAADGQLVRAIPLTSHGLREIEFAGFRPGADDVITLTRPKYYDDQKKAPEALVMNWSLGQPGPAGSFRTSGGSTHRGGGNAACLTPDGKSIIQRCDNNDAACYDLTTGRQTAVYHGSTEPIVGIAVDAASQRVLTGAEDGTARLWNLATGQQLLEVTPKPAAEKPTDDDAAGRCVQAVAFVPGANQFITGCHDDTLILWDAATGQAVRNFGPLAQPREFNFLNSMALAISPDGSRMASFYIHRVGRDRTSDVIIWDIRSGEKLMQFAAGTQELCSIAFSPDGRTLAIGGYDNVLRLFDAATGDLLHNLPGHKGVVESVQSAARTAGAWSQARPTAPPCCGTSNRPASLERLISMTDGTDDL